MFTTSPCPFYDIQNLKILSLKETANGNFSIAYALTILSNYFPFYSGYSEAKKQI